MSGQVSRGSARIFEIKILGTDSLEYSISEKFDSFVVSNVLTAMFIGIRCMRNCELKERSVFEMIFDLLFELGKIVVVHFFLRLKGSFYLAAARARAASPTVRNNSRSFSAISTSKVSSMSVRI